MGVLDGKTALVVGVANRRSIAWAIAAKLAAEGDRKSTRLNSSHIQKSRMPSSA